MENKILELLRQSDNYLSGEELSSKLKISRQALWKHIQNLRDVGYDIAAVPHLGYRFISAPDRLFPWEIQFHLNTKVLARKLYYFESCNSTMDMALKLAEENVPEGTLVVAETQTKGRGRLNRHWLSPKYKGIYLSLILRPMIAPNQAPLLTLLSAVAVCQALESFCGILARIKWPNDILINQKKVGGILTELNAEMDVVRFVIVGIGLNVNNEKEYLLDSATSLKVEKKVAIYRVGLLQEILRSMENLYFDFQKKKTKDILQLWRGFALSLGKRVRIVSLQEEFEGQAIDVDEDGSLLVRSDAGIIRRVTTGDVVHCR